VSETEPTVFVVDDDPSVRRSTERLVRSMSERTIKFHRGHIMETMQADSVATLVRMAGDLGIAPQG
jgi:FixJ family two-component response regulator